MLLIIVISVWKTCPILCIYTQTNTVNHRSHAPDEVGKWENKIAFIAQSTAVAKITYNSEPTHTMDFTLYGLYACHDVFEEEQRYKQLYVPRVFGLNMLQKRYWRIAETSECMLRKILLSGDSIFIDGVRGNWA